ncbi:MAG: hypothetical protein J5590_04815 [Clostridia bacterium]|nr:hypothetical protein [Clostridia bacterium]
MIEICDTYSGGFYPMTKTDKWQVAYITHSDSYGEPRELKRHMTTDEAMILIRGAAELYTYENDKVICMKMKNGVLYNIKCATWHHLKISEDALLIVVEDSNIKKESTERMTLYADCGIYKTKG